MSSKNSALCSVGVHEFIFGGELGRRQEYLDFWEVLGFVPVNEGGLSAAEADKIYAHAAELTSIRLKHSGCNSFNTGYVRLQLWSELRNEGQGNIRGINHGSRWMGMYTQDIMQLFDSFSTEKSQKRWELRMSPLVHAALQHPPPAHEFEQPFVGLRELLVFGNDFRLAFMQRAGFDRPGFGTFDNSLAYKNTEGSHANVVQPPNSFSTEFYKAVFDYDTAPFGDAHDSGDEPTTIEALDLEPGDLFHIERIKAADCPSGLLQVYSPYNETPDYTDVSRPGSRNLCAYSVTVSDLDELAKRVEAHGGQILNPASNDEFAQASVCFAAPDGYFWIATSCQE